MKAPLSWLREFVPIDVSPDALAERLSLSGITVEEVVRTGADISGIVVGEVRSIRDHPNADNLVLVRAFDGGNERDIVCGARNFGVGDRVPLALPGARLPDGMEIATRTVRGETSDGMLCSAKELRIAEDHSGILLLDQDAPLGKEIVGALELDDVVFTFDITTNRGDLLSVAGIAREIAALYGLPMTIPVPALVESTEDAASMATVSVEDTKGCPRYVARIISNVQVGMSPWWMRRRLLACGMRPVSNVVDITNYVLLERGQPLHAFDLDTLEGNAIIVRKPKKGERITTLDGADRELVKTDVAICDATRVVAVAGVMGGAATEVTDGTSRILLESATFDPIRIRETAARLGLRSEASARFEKGSDPELPPAAADRAAQLLATLAGGNVARGSIDVYPKPVTRKPVKLRLSRASLMIGADQDGGFAADTLRALGCDVEATRSTVRATPPTWRPDLRDEVDLIEEVARYYGYDRVPPRLPAGARAGGLTDAQRARRTLRDLLRGAGLSEAQTQSLLPPWLPDRMQLGPGHVLRRAARVSNPLSEDESVLRPALIPGLALAAQRNVARRVLPVMLFEIGVVFEPADPVEEIWAASWLLTGRTPPTWHEAPREFDIFDSKGLLESILDAFGVREWRIDAPSAVERDDGEFDPGRIGLVRVGDNVIGSVGELHPRVAAGLDLPARVAVGRIDIAALLAAAEGSRTVVPSRHPPVTRDVALVVTADTAAAEVEAVIRTAAGEFLESVALFDRYAGEQLTEGHVSLAYTMTLRATDRTLTDAEADEVMARVTSEARSRAWSIRD